MDLKGKRIVVTGAFGSLGSAVVQAALLGDANVIAIDFAAKPADALPVDGAQLMGGIDLNDAEASLLAIDRAASSLGGIDALINIAGGFRWETVEAGSIECWDLMYGLNLRTAVLACRAALPHFSIGTGGRIVNIGAAAAAKAEAGMGAYAASKAGVAKLTEALAAELKDRSITVNALLPSIIDTPVNRSDMPHAEFDRWVTPAQLARIVMFLLCDEASAITGALIPVTGRV